MAGRCRVPVKQAFGLRTNGVRLSGAGQRAEGLRPERESTLSAAAARPPWGKPCGSNSSGGKRSGGGFWDALG